MQLLLHHFLSIFLLFSVMCVYAQNVSIHIDKHYFQKDESKSLILSYIKNIEKYGKISPKKNLQIFIDGKKYTFDPQPKRLLYRESYQLVNSVTQKKYRLYFTKLPIISIITSSIIKDDYKTLAKCIYTDDNQVLISNIGIEIRGGSSQKYPKKTYDIEFWDDKKGQKTLDFRFGNLRKDDDWILDAMYNEPLRIRSYIGHKLWLKMHKPYYLKEKPKAKSGADLMYVEMFLNSRYNGLYALSEQIDRKQLRLNKYEKGVINGELYKGKSWGAPTFTRLRTYDNSLRKWNGYDYKYPKKKQATQWEYIYQFTKFVMKSSDAVFKKQIWDRFYMQNHIDYFIFLNVLRMTDNLGKNLYIAKYNAKEPYFYVPWDLDGSFGIKWNGKRNTNTVSILSNLLMNRVIELNPSNYSFRISRQWHHYRGNILATSRLVKTIRDQYEFLKKYKVYERESLVFPNYNFGKEDLDYMVNWLTVRLNLLDSYFTLPTSIDNQPLERNTYLALFPNPAKDKVCIDELKKTNLPYKIFSLTGYLLSQGFTKNRCISITGLSKGCYILMVGGKRVKMIVDGE